MRIRNALVNAAPIKCSLIFMVLSVVLLGEVLELVGAFNVVRVGLRTDN